MKLNTKIKRDAHGLYVRTDGAVFRPVLTRYSYPVFQPAYERAVFTEGRRDADKTYALAPDPQLFAEGEAVKAHHRNQTPYAVVATPDGRKAFWWAHGMYHGKDSTECWTPQESGK